MPTALVTGASSGIGAAAAIQLAARGFAVALLGRRPEALRVVETQLEPPAQGRHVSLQCDVADPDQVAAAVDTTTERSGPPEAVVTAAGVCTPASLGATTPEIWGRTVAVNLTGTFLVARAAAEALGRERRSGSMVLLGSEQSFIGVPNYTAYAATKAALVGLTRALAAELAPGIRVNLLCPGPVDTPMLDAEFAISGDATRARLDEERRVPLRRIASADETARAAVWLLLDAPYATGSVLSLDGGTTGAYMGARAVQPGR